MKYKIYLELIVSVFLLIAVSACTKDKFTPVNMSELNPDDPLENSALDEWLKKTFLDEYNAQVIYRYHRYYHEADRNVSPPKIEAVQPMMTTVLQGYILPYISVAGINFMKVNVPKEWVLYGSSSIDGSNVRYAGTASGGVRVNLFGINGFSLSPGFVKGRLNVIHHEFTHILNQRYIMPADFPEITKSTYNGNWTNTPLDSAHNWGYVSSYASQNPAEDYAETTCNLLVSGQSWFDNWVNTSGTAIGRSALRAKEQNVVDYFNSSLNIDFRRLQKEVQLYIKDSLKDASVTYPYWIKQGLYKTLTINPDDATYIDHPLPASFLTAYNEYKAALLALNTEAKYTLNYLQLRFENSSSLVVRAAFTAMEGGSAGTQYYGDYSFSVSIDDNTGETVFTKINQADGTTFNNGNLVLASFTNTIQKFLTEDTFTGDWLPLDTAPELFTKTAGFYQTTNKLKFIYGTLGFGL